MPQDPGFTEEQKQYLEGFLSAIAKKRGIGTPAPSADTQDDGQSSRIAASNEQKNDPNYLHIAAQNRAVAAGGTLVPEQLAKREKHPFDMWDEMAANAAADRFPKGLDVFRHKFHGLFHVAPNQDAF